jgi:hypothetical protein
MPVLLETLSGVVGLSRERVLVFSQECPHFITEGAGLGVVV